MEIIEFFKKVTGLTPTKDQEEFLRALVDPARPKIAASCGRQTGKSLCAAVSVLWWVFEHPGVIDVLLMSAMDSYVYDHIEQLFHKNQDLLDEVVVEGVSGLVPLRGFATKKGSRVHVRGSTSKQVRGLGADIEVVDEAEEIPDVLLTTALGQPPRRLEPLRVARHVAQGGIVHPGHQATQAFRFSRLHMVGGKLLVALTRALEDQKGNDVAPAVQSRGLGASPQCGRSRAVPEQAHREVHLRDHKQGERAPLADRGRH